LNDFRVQAFRAVLAHEYGHFTHRDTAGGDISLRVTNDMMKFAYALAAAGQATMWNVGFVFFRFYNFLFRRISHGASRLQEILADRMAALKYGADAFEEGLTHAIRRSIEFPITANREITLAVQAGRASATFMGWRLRENLPWKSKFGRPWVERHPKTTRIRALWIAFVWCGRSEMQTSWRTHRWCGIYLRLERPSRWK
jgi:Zn-dependent protease with chaperone function